MHMNGPVRPAIRTPDQRIRVFVSSTLRELAEERRAVRAAIERLRLAPVMFELGARPHPPRALYRAYLAQSDVFVGIYGDSYGWVAPDESLSGLEDEYNLAAKSMPKLIYIKASTQRDERLNRLIDRIRSDDTAAYLPFENAVDLEEQVTGDLAALLAERFDDSRVAGDAESSVVAPSAIEKLPVAYTATIGREGDIERLRALLRQGDSRVISLIGPGGVGKSRLAIETARAVDDLFPDGVYFVLLEGVIEPSLLVPTVAHTLGIRDNGEAALEERIAHALAGRRVLIVLDNFEQIVDAAPVLVGLYAAAPFATFLVTSRVVLRIRGEQVYDVGALPTPEGVGAATLDRTLRSSACMLFVDRATAVKPGFAITEENASDIADICRRLEGLPLAIELAAAKVRMLTPRGIAERLERSLPLLTASVRDMPERHSTMRATIDWSVSLLPDSHRELFEDLGVFATRFTLEAVEALGAGRSWDGMTLDSLAALIDASLVKQAEIDDRVVFSMLALVREFALDRLKTAGDADAVRMAHADYYRGFVASIAPQLRGLEQADAVARLGLELPNLRAAVRHLIYTDRLDDAGDFAWDLLIYWWIAGFIAEVRVWMLELLDKELPITQHTRAVAWFLALWGEMWQRPSDGVVVGLGECVRLFTESGDEDAAAMALAARATARLQLPTPDVATAGRELADAARRTMRWSASTEQPTLLKRAETSSPSQWQAIIRHGCCWCREKWMPRRTRACAHCVSRSGCITKKALLTDSRGSAPSRRHAETVSGPGPSRLRQQQFASASESLMRMRFGCTVRSLTRPARLTRRQSPPANVRVRTSRWMRPSHSHFPTWTGRHCGAHSHNGEARPAVSHASAAFESGRSTTYGL